MSDELDFTKPELLQLRGGGEFRIYATDGHGECPIHGAYLLPGGGWNVRTWMRCGRYGRHEDSPRDIVRKPVRVQGWANYYDKDEALWVYETKDAANAGKGSGCLGQIYIDAELQS